jgi:hypothetical protein
MCRSRLLVGSACAAAVKAKRKANTYPSNKWIRIDLLPALICEKPMRRLISTLVVEIPAVADLTSISKNPGYLSIHSFEESIC